MDRCGTCDPRRIKESRYVEGVRQRLREDRCFFLQQATPLAKELPLARHSGAIVHGLDAAASDVFWRRHNSTRAPRQRAGGEKHSEKHSEKQGERRDQRHGQSRGATPSKVAAAGAGQSAGSIQGGVPCAPNDADAGISMLERMGIERAEAKAALEQAGWNEEVAAEIVLGNNY